MKTAQTACAWLLLLTSSYGSDVLHVILNAVYNADAQKISGTLSGVPGATVQTVTRGQGSLPLRLVAAKAAT